MPVNRILAIVVLFVLVFQGIGIVVLNQSRIHQIRKDVKREIKSGIPDSDLVVFEGSGAEWMWENDKEFRRDGKWYDVVRKVDLGKGRFRFFCFDDERETAFHAEIGSRMKQRESTGKIRLQFPSLLLSYHSAARELSISVHPPQQKLMLRKENMHSQWTGTDIFHPPA